MNKNKLLKTLLDWGLSPNEAAVYTSTLALGSASVGKVAAQANLKRSTVYGVLDTLKQKGLIAVEVRGLKQVFVAESPEMLLQIAESRKKELEDNLPGLLGLYSNDSKSDTIKYYEGVRAVRSVYEQLLSGCQPGDDYLVISNQEQWYNLDEEYAQKFVERRAKLRLNIRMLLQDSETAQRFKKFERNYNLSVRILPNDTEIHTNLVITPQRVVVQQLTFPIVALVIENKSIIQMHQQLFGIIWDSLP